MKEREDREDVYLLVSTFYASIRKDELLAPIFNYHISEEKWPAHLEKLTDFWMTALFGVAGFKGNPKLKHILVDKNFNHTIEQFHFGKWLELWFSTIDKLYDGLIARRAKDAARNMATGQFMTIWNNRPSNK